MIWMNTVAVLVVVALTGVVVAQQHEAYKKPVTIPRCCQEGFNFDSEHNCTADPNKPFHPLAVAGESAVVIHHVENTDVTKISCKVGEKVVLGNSNSGRTLLLLEEDSIRLISYQNGEITEPQQFCMAREISNDHNAMPNYVAKFCMPDLEYHMKLACADSTCVRKCCATGKFLVDNFCESIPAGKEWHPVFLSNNKTTSPPSDLKVIHGFPYCEHLLVYDDHQLLPTGDVLLSGHTVPVQDYCIDFRNHEVTNSTQEIALGCLRNGLQLPCPWKYKILIPILMSVSCVCLLFTWVVYISVWQLRTCTTGRCLISFISAMFVAFITLMALNLRTTISYAECAVTGRITHFSVLAMFFWLNVMSYHVLSVARSGTMEKQNSPRLFLMYSAYAWGCPLVVTLVGFVLDLTEAHVIRPDMFINCWIADSTAKWVYMYGIILCILIVNIGFFIASIKFLKQTQYSPNTGSLNHNISAWVYFKLFIFTGILWVTDVIFLATTDVGLTTHCDVLHIIFDIVNGLQGVYVFLVAVCLRRDLKVALN